MTKTPRPDLTIAAPRRRGFAGAGCIIPAVGVAATVQGAARGRLVESA